MRILKLFILISLALLILTGCGGASLKPFIQNDGEFKGESTTQKQKQGLSVDQKLEDFEYLFNILESTYPYFQMNKRQHNIDWLSNKTQYIKQIEESQGDLKFYITLDNIVKDLNYGHSHLLSNEDYAAIRYNYESVNLGPWLEVLKDPVVEKRYAFGLEQMEKGKGNSSNQQGNSDNLRVEIWPEIATAYVKIKSFEHKYIKGDSAKLKTFFNDLGDVQSLIIDIRGNSGGDSSYWKQYLVPFIISEQKTFIQYLCFRGGDIC